MDTVGDLARTLVLRTHQTRLNQEMDRLGVEIASGFAESGLAFHKAGPCHVAESFNLCCTDWHRVEVPLSKKIEAVPGDMPRGREVTGPSRTTPEVVRRKPARASRSLQRPAGKVRRLRQPARRF